MRRSFQLVVALHFVAGSVSPELVAGVPVGSVVTSSFFNGIIAKAISSCAGKNFYTRQAFLTACSTFPKFGQLPTAVASKKEIAAFFAHVTVETGSFCYIKEKGWSSKVYCKASATYPCKPGQKYYGRGPLQLTWNYNYADCGKALHRDLLSDPDLVSGDVVVSFKAALWFWMTRVRPVMSQGFGPTIKAINGIECGQPNASKQSRISFYKQYCRQFGVPPGPNLSC